MQTTNRRKTSTTPTLIDRDDYLLRFVVMVVAAAGAVGIGQAALHYALTCWGPQ